MIRFEAGEADVVVIGAGHAGIEAGLAAARLGADTIVFAMNLDAVANMPCNPSIGGTAKGHLVREIDALGGEMAKAADSTFLQSRTLNLGKGPAVHSLRVQTDRKRYHMYMKRALETQPGLRLKQAEIVNIEITDGRVCSVETRLGAVYRTKAVVIAAGTYLDGRIFVGEVSYEGGPDGMFSAKSLSGRLREAGISLRRFKTGTPARVHKSGIDLSKLQVQHGDEPVVPMSFETEAPGRNTMDCYLAYTNEKTHDIIRSNLSRSPMFSGDIVGVGPRYCPSIETKIVRFADKKRHQLFLEPVGADTEEMYMGGMSSSLPEEVQLSMIRSVEGFERAEVMRPAYAIEYDCIDPLQLYPTLEFKKIGGLFGAGQFNGTSGYEEAAAQGLVAGINAAGYALGREPLVLSRSSSYIGTMIDDLVTKGVDEPYRIMTSRSEYRLVLRQDNADMRLTDTGRSIGLISDERYAAFEKKRCEVEEELKRVQSAFIPPSDRLNEILESKSSSPVDSGVSVASLIRRPEISYEDLKDVDSGRPELPRAVREQVEISVKYEGYIKRQLSQIEQASKLEKKKLPEDFDYESVRGLRMEARQKLNERKPSNIGQASRIPGVNPADISVLLIYFNMV